MFFIIYQTTNMVNGKIYVGAHATDNINDNYLGSGKLLLRAIKKYGRKNFKKIILEYCSCEQSMYLKEMEIVNSDFLKRKDTYNITEGGKGGGTLGPTKGGYITLLKKVGLFSESNQKFLKEVVWENSRCRSQIMLETKTGFFHPSVKEKRLACLRLPSTKKKIKRSFQKIKHQQGSKNSQFGKIWITNGVINQKIKKEEEIPEGFWKGRKIKPYNSMDL